MSQEVLSLVSHATEQRLRNILEKISTISLHRLEVYRVRETKLKTGEMRLLLHKNSRNKGTNPNLIELLIRLN